MKSLALILPASFAAAALGQASYERILNADREPANWLTYSGNYQAHRYSALDQINRSNVNRLKVKWMFQVRGRQHFETTPLVIDGIMYLTDPPIGVTALDLRTGRPIWHFRRDIPEGVPLCCGQVNRGVAALDGQIFFGTIDSHLIALDARTRNMASADSWMRTTPRQASAPGDSGHLRVRVSRATKPGRATVGSMAARPPG